MLPPDDPAWYIAWHKKRHAPSEQQDVEDRQLTCTLHRWEVTLSMTSCLCLPFKLKIIKGHAKMHRWEMTLSMTSGCDWRKEVGRQLLLLVKVWSKFAQTNISSLIDFYQLPKMLSLSEFQDSVLCLHFFVPLSETGQSLPLSWRLVIATICFNVSKSRQQSHDPVDF